MTNEQKPKITPTYFIFSVMIFLGVVVLTVLVEPQKKIQAIYSVITIVPFLLGSIIAIITQARTKQYKYISLFAGALSIVSVVFLMSFEDVASLFGLYLGGYWVVATYLKQKK